MLINYNRNQVIRLRYGYDVVSLVRTRIWINPVENPGPYRCKLSSGSAQDCIDVQRVAQEHQIPLLEFVPPGPHPSQQKLDDVFEIDFLGGHVYIDGDSDDDDVGSDDDGSQTWVTGRIGSGSCRVNRVRVTNHPTQTRPVY